MKLTLLFLVPGLLSFTPLSAQYFFTGEVQDTHGDKLQNVTILVQSTGALYRTGTEGSFEIGTRKTEDTLLFAVPGYEPYKTTIRSADFLQITLKMLTPSMALKPRLLSAANGRTVSFPADVEGVSYSTVRRFLDMGMAVPTDAVKIEEIINYLNFYYEEPEEKALFHCTSELLPCPWNASHDLLCVNMCTRITDRQQLPPANLVYVIDASGSMDMPNKLPLIKSGFRLLIKNLRDIDTVSLVIFGSRTGIGFQGVPGSQKGRILSAIESLQPDGPSPGATGLKLAYQVARQQFIEGGSNKVILITDGDISNAATERGELKEVIQMQDQDGIHLSCYGVGLDTSRNSELPWLADAGHGNFAFINDAHGSEKVLLNELGQDICTVADSVCIRADFDTALVSDYHLIGFDGRPVAPDSLQRLVGGAISSGHSLQAIFELVPKKDSIGIENIAGIKISYSLPGKKESLTMDYSCPNRLIAFDRATGDQRKAACMALFGMKLKQSGYASGISWADVEKMTRKYFSSNNALDRDYIALVSKARKIYEHSKQN